MIKSKNITILGSGISGLGSAKLANKLGLNVFVSDNNIIGEKIKKYLNENKIGFEENGHNIQRLLSADQVIISPGISFVDLKKDTLKLTKKNLSLKLSLLVDLQMLI